MRRTLLTAAVFALSGHAVFAQTAQPPTTLPPISPPPTSVPATMAASQPASQPATQPATPQDVLDQMLKSGPGTNARPLSPIQGSQLQDKTTVNPIIPGNRPVTLKREGTYVVDRTGRVTKTADGRDFEFNFEADAQTLQDPPMILIPNLALMLMQDQLRLSGRDLKFRVTGIVTEYLGRNYLMLEKVVVLTDS